MRPESQHNGRRIHGMSACCQFFNDLLVTAMNTVKDADRQPAILQIELVEGMGVDHLNTRYARGAKDKPISALVPLYSGSFYEKNTFLGCHSGSSFSPVTKSINATNSPCVLTPRTIPGWASAAALTR